MPIEMNLRKYKRIIWVSLILLVIGSGTDAYGIGISAEIDKQQISFDETVLLTISISWEGEQFLYKFDDFPMPELDKLELLSTSSSSSTRIGDDGKTEETVLTYSYKLSPSNYGAGAVLPLELVARHRETGLDYPLETGRLAVSIDKPQPKMIETTESGAIWWVILVVVIVGSGATVALILIKQRSKRADRAVPAGQEYINDLENIKRETVSDGKLFYSRLFRLLVRYLESELHLSVAGKTGEEILAIIRGLENDNENENIKLSYIVWLEKINRVKYSPSTPPVGDIEEMYNAVRKFLENK